MGRSSDARFIVESYKASPELCIDSPEECYLELSYKKGPQVLASAKIYMSFFDVRNYYDHYTVGEGQLGNLELTPKKVNEEVGFEYLSLFPESDETAQEQKDDYIMFVHGWRMQYPERVAFGETAFKRLFWSGYKGRFGLYSWPTGWFEKPAHVYGTDQISYASGNAQNYGQSETLAREAGSLLSNLLAELNQEKEIHVMAHSMGNVVVSEALRNANSQIVEHYVASQAAEVASSYYPLQAFMNHKDPIFDIDLGNAEAAWRFYNTDTDGFIDTAYDMPPNHYTYTAIPVLHGPTTPPHERATALAEDWGESYYATIGNAAGTIINFHNEFDIALHGWEANQLTKPDTTDGPEWRYNYNFASSCEGLPCIDLPEVEDDDQVSDRYRRDDTVLVWRNERPLSRESATILAHIIPARTNALGQRPVIDAGNSVIDSGVNINDEFNYRAQNQDHSAQFYNSYLVRQAYWKVLLERFGVEL
jgi:hypothetical protein